MSGQHIRTIPVPGKISVSLLKSSIYCDLLLKATSCETTDNLTCTTILLVESTKYSIGCAILVGEVNDMPIFGKIREIVSIGEQWFFIYAKMQTQFFDSHVNALVVQDNLISIALTAHDQLRDHHALYCYKTVHKGKRRILIRLSYHVIL